MPTAADTELATPTRSFIYGMADAHGHLDTDFLYVAAEAVGFTTTKLRLGLKRMTEEGLLTSVGRGRKASISLTPVGLDDRSPDLAWTSVAYRADAGLDPWDGVWHLVSFEIPEQQRTARDAVRNQLVDLFGGQLSGGLYLSTFAWEPWIDAIAAIHGVADRITFIETTALTHAGRTDAAEIAELMWPVATVDQGYRTFIDRWTPLLSSVPSDVRVAVRAAFEAANHFEAAMRADALLPAELVPTDFGGPEARALFRHLIDALATHSELAETSLFSAYRDAQDHALGQTQREFWTDVYDQTSAP